MSTEQVKLGRLEKKTDSLALVIYSTGVSIPLGTLVYNQRRPELQLVLCNDIIECIR